LLLPQALKGAWVCSTKRGMEPKIYDLKEVEVDERKKKKKKKKEVSWFYQIVVMDSLII